MQAFVEQVAHLQDVIARDTAALNNITTTEQEDFFENCAHRMEQAQHSLNNMSHVLLKNVTTKNKHPITLQSIYSMMVGMFDEHEMFIDEVEAALQVNDNDARYKMYNAVADQFYTTHQKKQKELLEKTPVLKRTRPQQQNDDTMEEHATTTMEEQRVLFVEPVQTTPLNKQQASPATLPTPSLKDIKSPKTPTLDSIGLSETTRRALTHQQQACIDDDTLMIDHVQIRPVLEQEYLQLPNFLRKRISITYLNECFAKMSSKNGSITEDDLFKEFPSDHAKNLGFALTRLNRAERQQDTYVFV